MIRSTLTDKIEFDKGFLFGILKCFVVENHLGGQIELLIEKDSILLWTMSGSGYYTLAVGSTPLNEISTGKLHVDGCFSDKALKGADVN